VRCTFSIAALALLTACGQAVGEELAATDEDAPRAADYRSTSVQDAIEGAADIVRTRGFAAVGEPRRGFLVDHSSDVEEQPMRAGTCYLVLAAASSAMRELDLRVFDSDGGEVVTDATNGPTAALRFCPSQSGTYFVTVSASAGSGLYELRSFRGPTGLDVRIDDLFRQQPAPTEPSQEPR
jgi:hypothetical protein